MADTRQVVSWSLERNCPFRLGKKWFLPEQTCNQLADLRTVAEAAEDGRIVDSICVTGWTTVEDNGGKSHRIPSSGFRIEERLGVVGGMAEAIKTCGQCEANAKSKVTTQVAGCFGHLDVSPDSEELENQLWKVIESQGLEERLRSVFHITKPLWYGLWISSPLHRVQAEVLYELLDAVWARGEFANSKLFQFLNALTVVISWELPLHVSLAPLGHTDLGWYTVFPHCPRCKANAPVGRWTESYPTEPHECAVCGHTFIPNDHQSSTQDDYDWNAESLEKKLGERAHEELTRHFLIHQGCTKSQVEEIIDNNNHGPLLRKIAQIRKKRAATLRQVRGLQKRDQGIETFPRNLAIPLTDDLELELVLIPSGEFAMGSTENEQGHCENESPLHEVRITRPFYIGRFTVTGAQWQAVMGRNPSRHKDHPDLPVDRVSWLDCQAFCDRLCTRLKRVFRLPSEAEWEYTCRAGTTTSFAFGEKLLPDAANFIPYDQYMAMPGSDTKRGTTPVGSFAPNAWGIYDMHGNVDEWCEDVWHPTYKDAPCDGTAWLTGEDKEPFRVVRGGWCSATELVCSSASRRQLRADAGSSEEEEEGQDDLLDTLMDMMFTPYGFRVVCEAAVG